MQNMDGISSVDQVENSTRPSSPLYWDSDEDGDGGPRPSELYGGYTWEIEKYSQITGKKIESNVFEAGSYNWYIVLHTQALDESNFLSLFLCVANADKLLPGWSHLAFFTMVVVNKGSKKSICADALHRFWKKSDSWGFTEFMELSKLEDGFIDGDTLIIEADVQVIRERVDRPFRCLDPQYRLGLIGWYRTDVEQIFRHFVEEGWAKLGKSIEDRTRWSSFCAFCSNVDPPSRRHISLVQIDSTLKVIVKHFPIDSEKSIFVMDSIYNGLKALKGKKSKDKAVDSHIAAEEEEDLSVHFIRIEKDSFILVDDALQLLERAALNPFPPKDEKGSQDGAAAEEFDEDTDERGERRLTELGRQAIEIFVLDRIFSKIQAAYQALSGTPSSPLCWDDDEDEDEDEDEDGGPRPSELYGEHTWEIDNYSQITEKELRSNVFEAGSYKWLIEFHPQILDESNFLSLFLCVANADKLLPGWSHLAYFTIRVVNHGSETYFFRDALHRFWKKAVNWGWSKFMKLSELEDGFIDDDTLIIEADVQVIRERVDRPFRCLDPQYRLGLIGWYQTDLEQIFRHFVEERWAKLGKLIEDRTRWSSFCAFWSNVDLASKRRMSRVEMDSVLKVIVKHFSIDSEVAVFVMDSIYNGLKALKGQHKGKKSKIRIENDSFKLVEVDDALQLLERTASDQFPPKDEKVPQDGAAAEEFNKDPDERRLTEMGRQTIEIFVLERIFSEIEAAVNGTPSSPLCLDSDEDEDDDGGPEPSELHQKHTWEINKYSQITIKILRSKAFEAGGCKWYILFYPQGNGVSNKHLSLFLCVANRDKLLPGWSHFAHFTLSVVHKGSKEFFYQDALHRFWKKDDQWGWDQFMEISKFEDGFIDDDTLIIRAGVQVIRERVDRPFPCLEPEYRGVEWYRTQVEQIFHDFVLKRLAKLRKLTEDISRWSSFCAFWSNVGPASRRRMSRVEMDPILKAIVKHFPIDSRVAVFVMDSLYNGLKALKGSQHKGKKSEDKAEHSHAEEEDLSLHFIRVEKDSFILVDDALQLLERAASNPFPPKDEKGPQDKDTIERRLTVTELGREAIELFVLRQIFSKIQAAYQALSDTPSSTLCWDSDEDDDEDDDGGPKPSELYKMFTWEINKYSQITERSLQSKAFEAGGCKWNIEFYPQGNGVSNKHLSLFLCVANRNELLPGWSHFAHFTLSVVNKGSKEFTFGDALHRFWEKDDKSGWSKCMELSKLEDGFIDDDTLIIEADVQVLSERADRPFPCLDPQYRGYLMRWYRNPVEQIFRHFVEERLAKLRKLREDKSRWSRRRMSLVKMDPILKAIVKHFPIDSKVAVFVMDSIYNGLKALEGKKSKAKAVHSHTKEDLSVHFIRIEKDSFILAELDDALQLLAERAASEPKDEKGPQDRDAIERRLTELGRYTIEILVLEQIFREIEAAYEEDVAFRKQEELIREEEEEIKSQKKQDDEEKSEP